MMMTKMKTPQARQCPLSKARERGYILLTSAVSLTVLLGFLGLGVDVGFLQFQKRRIQSAADAAAAGAAFQLATQASHDTAKTEGLYDSKKNGFEDGVNGVTVTINIPPTIGNYTTNNYAAEAIVRQANPTYFMQLFNISSVTVAARSVATAGNSGYCIYALDPAIQDAFLASGGTTTVNAGCGIYVNSSNTKGMEGSGGACIDATNVNLVQSSNSGQFPTCAGWPNPNFNQKVVADPLAYLTAPTVPASCDYTNYSAVNGATLNPGTYCGGITVQGGITAYLNTGLYILNGGGLTVSGASNLISNAGGVTFDNTSSAGHSYNSVNISGGSATNLFAPTTSSNGDLAGILFFDRTGASSDKEAISGGSGANFTGAIYFPHSEVDYTGGSAATGDWTIIVADKVVFSGGSSIGRDFSNYPDGSPIKKGATIAE